MTTYLASSPVLATSAVCPKCGQPRAYSFAAPDPGFYVLVRIHGEAFRLKDPLRIGGRHIKTGGRILRTEIIPIVVVQA